MLAQIHHWPPGWGITEWAIAIVAIAGIIALVWIGLKALKITPPEWFIQALWVVAIVVVIIVLIRVVASMW